MVQSSSQSGSSSSGSPGIPTPPESYDGGEIEFARPPEGFDPVAAREELTRRYGQDPQSSNPSDAIIEPVDDEINRIIAEVEEIEGPLTDEEKAEIAGKIHSLREGSWLDGLKVELVGKDVVPVAAFNRLVAEYEETVMNMAAMGAQAEAMLAEKYATLATFQPRGVRDAEIDRLASAGRVVEQQKKALEKEKKALEEEKKDLEEEKKALEKEKQRLQERNDKLEQACSLHKEQTDLLEGDKRILKEKIRRQNTSQQDNEIALSEMKYQVSSTRVQLDASTKALRLAREAASRHSEKVELLQKKNVEANQREVQYKAEIGNLKQEVKDLKEELDLQASMATDVQELNSKLEAELAGRNSNQKGKRGPNKATTISGDAAGPSSEEAPKLISELQAKVKKGEDTIKGLRAELEKARKPPQPEGGEGASSTRELQARCEELREARDHFRQKWAQGVVGGNANLKEFWEAVENTSGEIKKLYQGIERLSRLLGVAEGVIDTPQVLEKIITQVSTSVDEAKKSPELTVLSLRVSNTAAQMQIETLRRELDHAKIPKTADEIKAMLRIVDEEEMEKRVSSRTQSYRNHRRMIMGHIFDAQFEFLDLAKRSDDRDEIKALVNKYLVPGSLPMIQVVPLDRV